MRIFLDSHYKFVFVCETNGAKTQWTNCSQSHRNSTLAEDISDLMESMFGEDEKDGSSCDEEDECIEVQILDNITLDDRVPPPPSVTASDSVIASTACLRLCHCLRLLQYTGTMKELYGAPLGTCSGIASSGTLSLTLLQFMGTLLSLIGN